MKRRPGILIYMLILEKLRAEPRGPTRLAQSVNVAYDKFVPYLQDLERKGFVTKEGDGGRDVYSITQEGINVFLDWERVWEKIRP